MFDRSGGCRTLSRILTLVVFSVIKLLLLRFKVALTIIFND
jgi:hypothetical protein